VVGLQKIHHKLATTHHLNIGMRFFDVFYTKYAEFLPVLRIHAAWRIYVI